MHLYNRRIKRRSNRGISIILLVIVLAIFQLAIDFFAFNLVRVLMVEREVNGICEAASLAGTSILAKLDVSNDDSSHKKLAAAQIAACRCAKNMVRRGHVLGQVIDRATSVAKLSDLGIGLKPDSCRYFVTVADPQANYAAVNPGDPTGRTISCYIAYGYRPIFLEFLGNLCYAVTGNCVSGLPQIDTVLVLDLSGSMDDQTTVTFVRREWIHSPLGAGSFAAGTVSPNNPNSIGCGIVQYVSLYCPSSPHTVANYLGWNYDIAGDIKDDSLLIDGSLVNILPPENLDKANNEPHGAITHPMYFDAYLRSHYPHYDEKIRYLPWEASVSPYWRALDFATPPGNCDLSVGLGGNGDAVTDLAGNPAFGPHGMTVVVPQINAFSDSTWQQDGNNYFGYQPAAPGTAHSLIDNDPIPSPDQQTFTDLVVNITDPNTAGPKPGSYPYEQPLQGPDHFIGFAYTFPADEQDPLLANQTFNFPNIAVVVEAARGNLENTPVLSSGLKNGQLALIDRPVSVDGEIFDMRNIEPKDGYQRAYQRLAMLFTQPLASVLAAADQGYLQKLHKFADCRFALITFSSAGPFIKQDYNHLRTYGTLNDQSVNLPDSRSFYIYMSPYDKANFGNRTYDSGMPTSSCLNDTYIKDGNGQGFRMPRIALDVNAEHYLDCVSKNKLPDGNINNYLNAGNGADGIYNCRVQSLTDTGEALTAAHSMFHSSNYNLSKSDRCRQSAQKVIVVFTDGEPTDGINGKEAQTMLQIAGQGNGHRLGNTCQSDGVAIFSIGLNLAKGKTFAKLKDHQFLLLGDKQPEPDQMGGIAWRAGQGGRYYPCENLAQLKLAFSDIARHFSQSQK